MRCEDMSLVVTTLPQGFLIYSRETRFIAEVKRDALLWLPSPTRRGWRHERAC